MWYPRRVADAFDFYPCLVDDAPASIYVNLGLEDARPPGADTLYCITIQMRDPGSHGAGTADEAEVINAFEETAIASLAPHALVYAGRVRTRGTWEAAFYGPAGQLAHVQALGAPGPRRVQVHDKPDPDWTYYRELLLPDAERTQWMDDRRLVQVLQEQGDRLTTPRRVDHRVNVPEAQVAAFVARVKALGFAMVEPMAPALQVYRTDPIELDHIHDVVMSLVDAAEACGGTYDGWTTSIES